MEQWHNTAGRIIDKLVKVFFTEIWKYLALQNKYIPV